MSSTTANPQTKQNQGVQRDYTPIQRRTGQFPTSGNQRNDEQIERFEQKTSELYDLYDDLKNKNSRLVEQAQDHLTIALMFARRAATE